MKRRLAMIGGVIGVAALAAACTSGSGSSGGSGGAKLVNGATFTEITNTDLGTLNPYLTIVQATSSFDQFLYDTLTNVDASGRPVPQLAGSWQVTTSSATFTLRPGITCSDGTPLAASDVAADVNWVADPSHKSALLGQYVQPGTKATGDDAHRTVQIRSGAPDPFLLADLGALPIVCKAGLADPKGLAAGKYGTGLFKIEASVNGDHYSATRRTDYKWGPGSFRNNQKGLPDKVVFRVVTNETTAANLLLSGQVNNASISGSDSARVAAQKLFKVDQYQPLGELYFNQAPGHPGADIAVRKAVVQALNLPQIGKVLAGGSGRKMTQLLDYLTPTPCSGNTVDGNIPVDDIAQANSALDAAGWHTGSGNVRTKNGKQLTFALPYQTSPGQQTAAVELMQSQLAKVGIKLVPKVVDAATFGTVLGNDSWDLALAGIGWAQPSGMVPWFSGKSFPKGGTNIGSVDNPSYDKLAATAATMTGNSGCPTWRKAESALISDLDVVPFYELATPMFGKSARFSTVQFAWSIRMTAS